MASTFREDQLRAASSGMSSNAQPSFIQALNQLSMDELPMNQPPMDELPSTELSMSELLTNQLPMDGIPRTQLPMTELHMEEPVRDDLHLPVHMRARTPYDIWKKAQKIKRLRSHVGAQQFVESFYICLNGTSLPLRNFYASSNTKYTTCANPVTSDITINGLVLTGGPDQYEEMIKAQRQTPSGIEARVKYEVEGWDVHILNPEFTLACPENLLTTDTDSKPDRRAKDNIKASLLLQVTGMVSYGVDKDAPRKMFNDVFVLVPNWDTHVKNPPRNARRWLIMSQNFRAL